MRFACAKCQTAYNITDDHVAGQPFRFICKKCGHRQVVVPSGSGAIVQAMSSTTSIFNAARPVAEDAALPAEPLAAEPAKPENEEERQPTVELSALQAAMKAPTGERPRPVGMRTIQVAASHPAEWFVAHNKVRNGPWTVDQIKEWLARENPTGVIHAWKNGMAGWDKIDQVPAFMGMLAEFRARQKTGRKAVIPSPITSVEETIKPAEPAPSLADMIKPAETPTARSTQKIDLSQLAQADGPGLGAGFDPVGMMTPPPTMPVALPYVPPERVNPWKIILPVGILLVFGLAVLTTLVLLDTYTSVHVNPIPDAVMRQLPVLGPIYARNNPTEEDRRRQYAEINREWAKSMEMRAEAIQAQKAQELAAAEELEQRKRDEDERRQRMVRMAERLAETFREEQAARQAQGNGGRRRQQAREEAEAAMDMAPMEEMNFEAEEDMATEGPALGSGAEDVARVQPLDAESINTVVNAHMPEIAGCFRAARDSFGEAFAGECQVNWIISHRGLVRNAKVVSGYYQQTAVGDCILQHVERWKFPRGYASTSVTLPFRPPQQ